MKTMTKKSMVVSGGDKLGDEGMRRSVVTRGPGTMDCIMELLFAIVLLVSGSLHERVLKCDHDREV